MEQIWHIFKKDVRRFWPLAFATLILLAWFANEDRWRADALPSNTEGWLNLLLPFAWVFLIGMVVIEDPLAGDRQFWLALPCRGRALLAAKALFFLAFIHVPYFAACWFILAARGFQPLQQLPQLIAKQFLLLIVLTLPAAALAALVRNVAHFVLAALVAGAGLVLLNSYFAQLGSAVNAWYYGETSGNGLVALAAVGAGAISAVALQYARRSTRLARGLAITAALCASIAYAELPREASAAIDCAIAPAKSGGHPTVSLALDRPRDSRYLGRQEGAVGILAPLQFDGVPAVLLARAYPMSLELADNAGERYEAVVDPRPAGARPLALRANVDFHPDRLPDWLQMAIQTSVYNRLQARPAVVTGAIRIDYFHRKEPVTGPAGARFDLPGWGKCSSVIQPSGFSTSLKVDCESTGPIPYSAVKVAAPGIGQQWTSFMSGGSSRMYPSTAWLSPLNHRDAFFSVAPAGTPEPETAKWRIPEEELETATVTVSPDEPAGSVLVRFEFPLAQLREYVIPERR